MFGPQHPYSAVHSHILHLGNEISLQAVYPSLDGVICSPVMKPASVLLRVYITGRGGMGTRPDPSKSKASLLSHDKALTALYAV